jgi:hypothetical protein
MFRPQRLKQKRGLSEIAALEFTTKDRFVREAARPVCSQKRGLSTPEQDSPSRPLSSGEAPSHKRTNCRQVSAK